MSAFGTEALGVGPVLQATPFADAVITAIRHDNDDVTVQDEGAYLRVLVPRVCRLSRGSLEEILGEDLRFPGDLEVVMSSFAGVIRLTEQGAEWRLAGEPAVGPAGEP